MQPAISGTVIEGQADFAFGNARIVRRVWDAPIDVTGNCPNHYLEHAMLPRSDHARGCFFGKVHTRPEPIGELFFFPAGHVVRAHSHCRSQHSIICTFQPEAARAWLGERLEWSDAQLRASLHISHPGIRARMLRLGAELHNPGFGSSIMVELLAAEIGIEVARYLIGVDRTPSSTGLSSRALRQIDERLMEDGAPPALSDLADLCGVSIRHLTRAFRNSRQRSIGQYITERRIQRARELLGTDASVKSVASLLGFRSSAAFSISFRRATGERPSDYRRRL